MINWSAVGLIVSAAGRQATGVTPTALRGVVHAMRGWPTPIGIGVNGMEQMPFSSDGAIVLSEVEQATDQLMRFACAMAPPEPKNETRLILRQRSIE